MTAAEIAHALRGRKSGRAWVARCPGHQDRRPSLPLRDGVDAGVITSGRGERNRKKFTWGEVGEVLFP